jgi:flagellar motor switch protein FliM
VGFQQQSNDVVPYDFGVPQRLGREATSGLRRIHEVLSRDLEHELGDIFEADLRGSVVSLEQTRYQAFVEQLPARAYHAVLASDALDGDVQLIVPDTTALRLVDRLLNTANGPDRNLTIVDARLIEDYLPTLLGAIRNAYRPYHPVEFSFSRSELNGQMVKVAQDDDVAVILELLFTFGEDDITFVLCYPQKSIGPILTSLTDMERAATEEAITRSSPMRRSILRVPIPVTVALPPTWLPAGAVDQLKVGDVLQTGIAADTPPMLSISGRPALRVRPTTRRNRVACTVVGDIDTNGR